MSETSTPPATEAQSASDRHAGAGGALTRFVLVRHGEASGNRELRYLGVTDAPLTEHGQQQALQLATALSPYSITAIYASPLSRARVTADAIASALQLPVTVEPNLREENYGAWEALTHAEVLTRDPERLAAWEAGAVSAPPGGESLAEVSARIIACADTLAARHADQTIALVSHVGPIKALICATLGLPLTGTRRMWLDPASVCVVDWLPHEDAPSTGILRIYNSIAHLDPPVRWLTR